MSDEERRSTLSIDPRSNSRIAINQIYSVIPLPGSRRTGDPPLSLSAAPDPIVPARRNGWSSAPKSRFVRVELNAVEIDAFVEWGYLEPKDREDICAIEQAANAFDSGRPEIAGRPGIAVKVRKV